VTVYVLEEFPGVASCTYVQGSLNLTNYLGMLGKLSFFNEIRKKSHKYVENDIFLLTFAKHTKL
jgi:hypothetical protein